MRPLRYSINVTLDGCCDHTAVIPTEAMHEHAARTIARADALLFGRVTYEMMESAWRDPEDGDAFAATIDAMPKFVVSSTLESVDWNAELLRGDLGEAVRALKSEPGDGLYVGGMQLPLALASLGLIDEYTFVVHPRVVGHGPYLLAGLAAHVDLEHVDREELGDGIVAMTYVPRGV